jgi:hypothetical protein
MKRMISLLFSISLVSCSSIEDSIFSTSQANEVLSSVSSFEEDSNNMNISLEGVVYSCKTEDNNTVRALKNLLPLKISMEDLNGNEKYAYVAQSIKKDQESIPKSINAGDLMVFSDNCLVLFYKSFKTSYSYVRIGSIQIDEAFTSLMAKDKIDAEITK